MDDFNADLSKLSMLEESVQEPWVYNPAVEEETSEPEKKSGEKPRPITPEGKIVTKKDEAKPLTPDGKVVTPKDEAKPITPDGTILKPMAEDPSSELTKAETESDK